MMIKGPQQQDFCQCSERIGSTHFMVIPHHKEKFKVGSHLTSTCGDAGLSKGLVAEHLLSTMQERECTLILFCAWEKSK
ncbi:hypothetical protein DEO72_LG10g2679 [Vigna unguiculata]|uniref:Uncharacterized protein n=1 Tax=Vigna unguiculata TaxID=3917 RepID=A0A4D6NCJ9_VIGUN|nr:hypothetical protein DEO72_LG10g2679 [Vigna unguiculata]